MQGFAVEELAMMFRSLQAAQWNAILIGGQSFAHGIDLMQAAPWDDMRAAAGYGMFFQQRLPQLVEQVERKRKLHVEALQARDL